jgi:enterochelin esterase-like enzyme
MDLQAAGAGQLRKHQQFRSRLFRYSRDLIVYLPAGYDEQPSRRFPVLYMQDGQNLFDPATSFIPGMHWRMGETADELIAAGAIQPLIIVGIYNAGDRRVREYTPTRAWRLGGGRADLYGRMVIEEIKPFIESEYRTLAGPAHTGLGGSSLGGLVTLYLGLTHPHVFGRLAALSPSVWWGGRWIHGFAGRAPAHPRPRIWLDIGAREGGAREGPRIVQDVTRFRDILAERGWTPGRDLHFEEVDGAEHNEAAWARRVGPFLQFLFPAAESAV